MIAILTDPGVGGTFLNWSIHYLAGHSEYFLATSNKFVKLIDNPISDGNAHKFQPNQPNNLEEFDRIYNVLSNAKVESLIYFHHFRGSDQSKTTQIAVDKVTSTANKIIVVGLHPQHALYQCSYKSRSKYSHSFLDHSRVLSKPDQIFDDFVDYFFSSSKQKWDDAKLTEIWDKREFIALNMDPFCALNIIQAIGLDNTYYKLDAVDLMTNFDRLVFELFEYLEIDICKDRLDHWLSVYSTWKTIHLTRLNFVQHFDTIVDSIISGREFDLECFNLDIKQEAAIQHQLLYKHNLNLKTWQLTKFVNTQQLHDLLEPNIYHDLSQSKFRKTAIPIS